LTCKWSVQHSDRTVGHILNKVTISKWAETTVLQKREDENVLLNESVIVNTRVESEVVRGRSALTMSNKKNTEIRGQWKLALDNGK
jgi:hypothetical protein